MARLIGQLCPGFNTGSTLRSHIGMRPGQNIKVNLESKFDSHIQIFHAHPVSSRIQGGVVSRTVVSD